MEEIHKPQKDYTRLVLKIIFSLLIPVLVCLGFIMGFTYKPLGLSVYERLPTKVVGVTLLFAILSLVILSVEPPILASTKWTRFFLVTILILILATGLSIAAAIHTTGAFYIDFSNF